MKLSRFLMMTGLFLLPAVAQATIFEYVDDKGETWYVNDINAIPKQYRDQVGEVIKSSTPEQNRKKYKSLEAKKKRYLDKIKKGTQSLTSQGPLQKKPSSSLIKNKPKPPSRKTSNSSSYRKKKSSSSQRRKEDVYKKSFGGGYGGGGGYKKSSGSGYRKGS